MKYSEAMRLGAMLAPQAYGFFKDGNGKTCANGAVMEAMGVNLIPMGQHFKRLEKNAFFVPGGYDSGYLPGMRKAFQ